MKKLMMAIAVVLTACCVEAASYTWKAASSYTYTDATKATKAEGTAYLFNAGAYSQATLIAALAAGDTLADIAAGNSLYTATMVAGKINTTDAFTYNGVAAGNDWNAYFALITDTGAIYVSNEKTIGATALSEPTAIIFGSQATPSATDPLSMADGYAGAGWYTMPSEEPVLPDTPSEDVPEPTSGLLLLVGAAALALKRKVA